MRQLHRAFGWGAALVRFENQYDTYTEFYKTRISHNYAIVASRNLWFWFIVKLVLSVFPQKFRITTEIITLRKCIVTCLICVYLKFKYIYLLRIYLYWTVNGANQWRMQWLQQHSDPSSSHLTYWNRIYPSLITLIYINIYVLRILITSTWKTIIWFSFF